MKTTTVSRPRIHFTRDHEWIDFNGSVGFVGVSAFKLTGIKNIDHIEWLQIKGTIAPGTLIANIHGSGYIIPVHAPVNCRFLGTNVRLNNNLNLVLESPQDQGWIFFVAPIRFVGKAGDDLFSPEQYQQLIRVKVS